MKTAPLVILFADRNPGPGRRLRAELRRRGAEVLLATTSDEAIHQAALAAPDLVVMDDDLEVQGQVDLGVFMHEAFPNAGIILLRGPSPPTTSASGLNLLLWGHKPIDDEILLEVIASESAGRLEPAAASGFKTVETLPLGDEVHHYKHAPES